MGNKYSLFSEGTADDGLNCGLGENEYNNEIQQDDLNPVGLGWERDAENHPFR